ncbi:MAG TPA: hypothetical protein VGM96_11130 [Reyranella sp.]|jgi:hypothetical protein
MQRREDRVDHGIEFRLNVSIPEAKNAVAGGSQETVSPIVVRDTLEMLATVEFDDEPAIERGEVTNVEADLVLSAELETADLSAP